LIQPVNFSLEMFKLKLDVFSRVAGGRRREGRL
jgi:hypothetical protein